MKIIKKELSDDLNQEYLFCCTHSYLLMQIATGKIDVLEFAKKEMSERGLDKNGKWVGFPKAREIWDIKK